MAEDIRMLFLKESLNDCEEVYANAVADPKARAWDYLVITAANEAQAQAYRAQVARRQRDARLPKQTRYLVIADPDGKRVGCGGATLNVLREIARLEGGERPFSKKRILVIHSGGDSKRAPQFSACGKLFARVPRALPDGRVTTLFDEFCVSTAVVPKRVSGGMLVMSGDVLLLFNALQIDLENSQAACVSIKAPAEMGTRHGVFLPKDGGVGAFLHKQPLEVLRACGAVNARGMVDIDTGAVWLGEEMLEKLYGLVREEAGFQQYVNDRVRLSFYGDFVYPMAESATLEDYLRQAPEGVFSPELEACRRQLWETLGPARLDLVRLSPAEFIHFGSTGEWRTLMLEGAHKYAALGWKRHVCAFGAPEEAAAACSLMEPGAQVGAGCALEETRLGPRARVGEGCVLSGADFDGELPPQTALSVLALSGGGFCPRVYGVTDNPKENSWMGRPLPEPLWEAKLFPICRTRREASMAAQALACGQTVAQGARLSLSESFMRADMDEAIRWQEELAERVRAVRVIQMLKNATPAAQVAPLLGAGDGLRGRLLRVAEEAPFPLNMRLFALLEKPDECWTAIHHHMAPRAASAQPQRIVRQQGQASLPARVNFGGGWTDTPPYCLEYGGTVLNAAVLLEGERPVYACARRLDAPQIRIVSEDQGIARTYTRLEALAPGDPYDPHALGKAALWACGVVPEGAQGPVEPLCAQMGGGVEIVTRVHGVPKGSGLGTSSILCAAAARALSQLFGQDDGDSRVAELALCMEQAMRTGGGWQDQAGGLLPGMKLVSTHAGVPQALSWRRVEIPQAAREELCARFALVYTGQRRMARNLLRSIMQKAIAHDPQTLDVLAQARRLAVLMAFELETGGVDKFAALMNEHWELSKRLDAGSTNTCIDHMIAACRDLTDGVMICGAGGGGFMTMMLKRGVPRQKLAERLDELFEESGVRVWDAQLLV